MQLWNRNGRLAAICIVASLFFLAEVSTAQAETGTVISGSLVSSASSVNPSPVHSYHVLEPSLTFSFLAQFNAGPEINRGPGGYLSWIKLALIAVVFLIWVPLSDRLNQDALRFGEMTGLKPDMWNTLNVLGFVFGFFLTISVPIFWVGYPIYVLAALIPPISYFLIRRSRLKASPTLANQIAAGVAAIKSGETGRVFDIPAEPLQADEGAEVVFSPAGADQSQKQANLIRARQGFAFPIVKDLVADALSRRGDVLMLDYTAQAVTVRMQVDGSWHQLPPMDRESGDAVLASLKHLAALNPQDRRSRQTGHIGFKYNDFKGNVVFTSQGVQTGERVQLKLVQKTKSEMNLGQLGMWPEMYKQLVSHLNKPGLIIVSAPPMGGLSTSWQATLMATDRVTRDVVSFVDEADREQDFENIARHNYPSGQSPLKVMHRALMAQPDCLVVPNVVNSETLDELTRQVVEEERTVITHLQSKSASEALLRLYSLAGDKPRFAKAVTAVTCQKLARRLCETCKQQVQVNPQLIQQLGGDPTKQNWLFNHFTGPRPDQVDDQGNPIEIPPCKTCSAFGYIGRIAFFELIQVNDQLRAVLQKQPRVETVSAAARKLGNPSLTQQAYRLALVGLTSTSEIQRVLKS